MSIQPKAAVYLRSQHLAGMQGLECQRTSVYPHIPFSSREWVMEYVDTSTEQRQMRRLLADAYGGEFQQVWMASPDRLSRISSQMLMVCQQLLIARVQVCFAAPQLSITDAEILLRFSEYMLSAQDPSDQQDDLLDDER